MFAPEDGSPGATPKVTGNNQTSASPSESDWYETIKLNWGYDFVNDVGDYDPMPDTWTKMDAILAYWQSHGVDGFRCDFAHFVPAEAWTYLIEAARMRDPEVYFIAEAYADLDGLFGRFGDNDRDLLVMLASQAAVALANARFTGDLEQKVAARTAEARQAQQQAESRAGELAVINSSQQGMAANLSFKAIVDLVGDRLLEVLGAQGLNIDWFDYASNRIQFVYAVENGQRVQLPDMELATGFSDEQLQEIYTFLKDLVISESGKAVRCEPGMVFEVGYSEIQKSPNYEIGFALRFPRFIRLRDDKSIDEIETLESIRDRYLRPTPVTRPGT